ncbi:MAG: hypothetical protein JNM94_16030 [Phycisphaerae bacterium]|nr:hypothetical protein [Phycisphaerae bacterium]
MRDHTRPTFTPLRLNTLSRTPAPVAPRMQFPALRPGAMFILPLTIACGVAAQTPPAATPSAPAAATKAPTPPAGVKDVFNVQFQDTDIAQALQMLSIQGQRNIITGKNVAGTVTANLFDVTVTEALDVILKALDLRYEEVGNFIYVYTREDWEQMQQARRKRESRRFSLEYINAKDANEFVAPLLSETGKVAFLGAVEKGVAPDVGNVGEDSWAYQAMLVVNDYPENLQAIADLLTEIDTPPSQVQVEGTIVSTKVDEDNAFGVDFTIIGDVSFTDFTNPIAAINNLIQGNNVPGDKATDEVGFQPADNRAGGVTSSVGQTERAGGFKAGIISENASVFLRVLDEVTDTMILARPRVLALNRQRAHILVGEKVGYLSTTSTETTTTQTVQFLDTGIKLIFRPFISSEGTIRMELAPSVSEAVLRQVTSDDGGGVVIPDERTNEITTNIRVKDGQTIVLGGLFQEKTTLTRRQVPGIGDVPIIGAAFKGIDDKLERREIIFLVTPTIMKDAVAAAWGEAGQQLANNVLIGAREGSLPWSRDRLSANQNQEALDALNAGDKELALYHVENSLRLNSNQPEVIQLRKDLGSPTSNVAAERDMLKQIMQGRMPTPAPIAKAKPVVPAADPLTQPAAQASAETQDDAALEMTEDLATPESDLGNAEMQGLESLPTTDETSVPHETGETTQVDPSSMSAAEEPKPCVDAELAAAHADAVAADTVAALDKAIESSMSSVVLGEPEVTVAEFITPSAVETNVLADGLATGEDAVPAGATMAKPTTFVAVSDLNPYFVTLTKSPIFKPWLALFQQVGTEPTQSYANVNSDFNESPE